jgi:hypothetical protein
VKAGVVHDDDEDFAVEVEDEVKFMEKMMTTMRQWRSGWSSWRR